MIDSRLYRELVPDAPRHRRTEADLVGIDVERAEAGRLDRLAEPGLQQPRLISSWLGSIDRLLLVFPAFGVEDPETSAGYRSIIRALRRSTRFAVVHHASTRATIRRWFRAARHPAANLTWIPVPDYVSLTDWAEDAYVSLTDAADGTLYLVEPWEFPRAGDALIAEYAQEHAGVVASQAPLIFQGGNCLVGDDFWLLGRDYFADSVELLSRGRAPVVVPDTTTAPAMVRQLFRDYVERERRLIVLGSTNPLAVRPFYGTRVGSDYFLDIAGGGVGTFQPIFHIDMFVTLIGRDGDGPFRVLVGSPAMADAMLGTTSPFGLADAYDRLARDLAGAGLEVIRNPLVHRPTLGRVVTLGSIRERAGQAAGRDLLPAVAQLEAAGATDATRVTVRDWHHVTWNNCLVEVSETHGRHVYMPTYGHGDASDLAVIDRSMRRIWRDLGFRVHALGDFNSFARRQGVVHCLKKYLERGA